MPRYNLAPNPSFRSGLAHYAPVGGATLAITNDYAFYGSESLQVTKSADNNSGFGLPTGEYIPVTAGLPYAVSIYLHLPVSLPAAQDANIVLSVQWLDSLNTVLSTVSSAVLDLSNDNTWARVSGVWVAPVGATRARYTVTQLIGGTAGQKFIADALLFEQASYVGGYLDNFSTAEEVAIVNKALSAPLPQVFGALQLNADISINDLILNTIDEFGAIWVCTGIDGWYGPSSPDLANITRGTEDGSYDVSGRTNARELTLNGVLFPPDNGKGLSDAVDRLVSAVNLVRKGGWLRTNEEPTKAAWVRLVSKPNISTVNPRGRTEFSIGLRAADPIKYEWNDSDPEGYTHAPFSMSFGNTAVQANARNNGTADVTAVFTLTGPLGAGSTITNSATDETITVVAPLRGRGLVSNLSSAGVTNNIATVVTTTNHHLLAGDEIVISGAGTPFDSVGRTYTVLAATQVFPYTINFALQSDNIAQATVGGQVSLADNDVLVIDTYERSVTYNGTGLAQRSKLATLTDWVKLGPGDNLIQFNDDVDHLTIVNKQTVSGVATLTSSDAHYLIPGETVAVGLGATFALSKKSLTSNVVTLTTVAPHGYSVGDKINVVSNELSIINAKQMSGTSATVTTVDPSGVSAGDSIIVSLPASAAPVNKALTSNVATLTTSVPHGFSLGDSLTIALPASAAIATKQLSGNQATLTTSTAHGFQVNDSITVTLGASGTVINKQKSGSQAIITTSAAHGFSVNDVVVMALPTTAALANSRSMAGSAGDYLATLNTSAAHNFSIGDRVTVNVGLTSSYAVTQRASSGTARLVAVSSATNFSVGDQITVSGVSADYNGTFYVTAISGNQVGYTMSTSLSEGLTTTTGNVVNNTIATGYNGTKIIETIPTSTSFTFRVWNQDQATSSTAAGTSATVTNTTNQAFNGTKTLTSASGSTFAYNY